jgi:hypothetical protein
MMENIEFLLTANPEALCELADNFADDDMLPVAKRAAVVRGVVEAMRKFQSSELTLTAGLQLLHFLSCNGDKSILFTSGAFAEGIAATRSLVGNSDCAISGCGFIYFMSYDTSDLSSYNSADVVAVLLECMSRHAHDKEVHTYAVGALVSFLTRADGKEALAELLRWMLVQEHGLRPYEYCLNTVHEEPDPLMDIIYVLEKICGAPSTAGLLIAIPSAVESIESLIKFLQEKSSENVPLDVVNGLGTLRQKILCPDFSLISGLVKRVTAAEREIAMTRKSLDKVGRERDDMQRLIAVAQKERDDARRVAEVALRHLTTLKQDCLKMGRHEVCAKCRRGDGTLPQKSTEISLGEVQSSSRVSDPSTPSTRRALRERDGGTPCTPQITTSTARRGPTTTPTSTSKKMQLGPLTAGALSCLKALGQEHLARNKTGISRSIMQGASRALALNFAVCVRQQSKSAPRDASELLESVLRMSFVRHRLKSSALVQSSGSGSLAVLDMVMSRIIEKPKKGVTFSEFCGISVEMAMKHSNGDFGGAISRLDKLLVTARPVPMQHTRSSSSPDAFESLVELVQVLFIVFQSHGSSEGQDGQAAQLMDMGGLFKFWVEFSLGGEGRFFAVHYMSASSPL